MVSPAAVLTLLWFQAGAQQQQLQRIQLNQISVEKTDGGVVTLEFGNMTVNEHSAMRRTWYTVNDMNCPVHISGAGITLQPSPKQSYLTFNPVVAGLMADRAVTAFELRFVLYDLFGDHIATIKDLRVQDVAAAGAFDLKANWSSDPPEPLSKSKRARPIEREERPAGALEASFGDAQRLLTVVSFVARVRPKEGPVWNFDPKLVSEELTKSLGFPAPAEVLNATRERK